MYGACGAISVAAHDKTDAARHPGNAIGDAGAAAIASAIETNATLKALYMDSALCAAVACIAAAAAMRECVSPHVALRCL